MRKPFIAAAVTLGVAASALPAAPAYAGTDGDHVPVRIFADSAPFYQKLPDDTPTAGDSDQLVAQLKRQTEQYYGTPAKPNIGVNYDKFAPTMYVARATDPVHDIKPWNCQGKEPGWEAGLAEQLTGVHLPADLVPDPSADGSISVWNPDTDTVVDTWQLRRNGDQWEACWGGKLENASQSGTASFESPFGASASGLAQAAYIIRHDELADGRIDHVINLGIPEIKAWPAMSWPANRTDGGHQGQALTMGQMLRLPAGLDVESLGLSPAATTVARAAQEYGIMITETSGSVAFGAQNSAGMESDQYAEIFDGQWTTEAMQGFPVDQLEALPVDYRAGDTPDTLPVPEPEKEIEQPAEPSPAEPASLASQVFEETNRVRGVHGLHPLAKDDCLTDSAGRHADFMIDDYRHSTDGEMDRIMDDCGLSELSENIATGQESAEEVVEAWMNSTDGHREAMLDKGITHMGTGATDELTWIQLFSTRAEDAPAVEMPPAEPVSAPAEGPAATGLEAENGLTPDALNLLRTVHQKWPDLDIGGVRQDSLPDHPSGRALDIMTGGNDCNPVGQEIADWAKSNADQLGVHYVIWCGQIWNTQRADEGWRQNTGHRDHVHITVHGNSRA